MKNIYMLILLYFGVVMVSAENIEFRWGFHREVTPQKFTFLVRYLPSSKRLWISKVDINNLPDKDKVKTFRISILKKSDGSVIFQKDFPFNKENILKDFGIEPADFSGDTFVVNGELLDKTGKIIASEKGRTQIKFTDLTSGKHSVGGMIRNEHMDSWVKPYNLVMDEFTFRKYPFTGNKLGKSDKVIPPFTPVEVNGHEVKVWGRTYLLGNNALPKKITVRQPEPTVGSEYEEILYSPINLFIIDENGKKELQLISPLKVMKSTESSAVLKGQYTMDGLNITILNTIEQDGVMKIDLKAIPTKKCPIKELYIDIPIKEDQAVLMHDITDVAYRKIHRDKKGLEAGLGTQAGYTPIQKRKDGIVWESSETEKKKILGTFQPMVWLGNEDRGLCWFADSDKGWILDDRKSALQIIRKSGRVILRVKFINKPVELNKPFEVTFGLLATPVKPLPAKWRSWIFPRWATIDWNIYNRMKSVRKIIEVGAGDPKFNAGMASPLAKDWEKTRNIYKKLHDSNNSTYMEYWCSDYLTMDVPEWGTYFGEWTYPANTNWFSHHYKGHSEPSCAWLAFSRITPSGQNYKAWCVDKKLKELGLFSYYEDNSHTRLFYDPAFGFGYVREDGKKQPQFDIWEYRDYLKRIATIYHDNGYENMLGVHSSAQMIIPAFTFARFTIDGEQPARYDDEHGKDYIDKWPDLEYIRAHVMGRQFGVQAIFLSEMTYGKNTKLDASHTRALMALMLPHDIAIWDGAMYDRNPIRKWHKIKNDFDFLNQESRFFPYWAKGKWKVASSDNPGILVTVWKIENRLLIMLSNIDDHDIETEITLDLEKLGLKNKTLQLIDAETNKNAVITNGKFKAKIKKHDFRIFRIN